MRRLMLMLMLMATSAIAWTAYGQGDATEDPGLFHGLEFRNIGPFRGGRSTAVAGHADQPMTFYMGGTGGGVWKTTNAGQDWTNVSDDYFKMGSVGAIDVAPSDPNLVLVGMGESPFRGVTSSHGDGVYLSTDAGKTWTHKGLADARQISSVKFHPDNPDHLLVAVQGSPWAPTDTRGVYRSTDGGDSFKQVLFVNDNTGAVDLKYDPSNPRIVYAAMWDYERDAHAVRSGGPGSGIWKSTDFGETWQEVGEGLPEEMGKIGVAPSGAQDGLVYAVIEAKDKGGLYKSTDGGDSWSHVNGDRRLHARSWYYMHVFADPTDPENVIVLNAPFMRSTDGGRTFSPVGVPHGDTHDLWINPERPEIMINANDGGATVTLDNGRTWSTIYNQPTAQFYRVNVDNQFFYKVYAGQQDNSTVAIRSRALDGSIGPEDFHSVGGCESAHVAFDPDNPRYVYAGCYLGQITEYDHETRTTRDIRAYPELAFGVPPKERKYRFNWNAPILVSQHDRKTIYHAGNKVLKSTDRGYSWEEVSPDLTRDEEERQGKGGFPITNEVSENYNTIFALAESPHDADTLWAGSDDGLVHVTRDGGKRWVEVTPKKVGRALINSIDISPHDPQTVYIAATRYKENDHTPLIYKTTDGGRSWQQIASDVMEEFVRVVREDPDREGLLYAGTENGLYVSFDGGEAWQSLQLDLPHVAITDMKVAHGDLILSTQGRGFWILDDIAPLKQFEPGHETAAMHLYTPSDTVDVGGTGGRNGGPVAPNPPSGAVIYYALGEAPDLEDTVVTLEIRNAKGTLIRTLKSDAKTGAEGGGSGAGYHLPARAGINRAVWDLRGEPLESIDGLWSIAGGRDKIVQGRPVPPGDYNVTLVMGDQSQEAQLTVLADPRLSVDEEQIAEQQNLAAQSYGMVEELQRSVNALRDAKAQVSDEVARLKDRDAEAYAELIEAGEGFVTAVDDWEAGLINTEREFFQDVLNWPDKLHSDLQMLAGTIVEANQGVTKGMRDRFEDLRGRFSDAMTARDAIVEDELAAYNRAHKAADLPAVMMKDPASAD